MVDLKAIYASKLFKASSRKEDILSAYQSLATDQLAIQAPDSVDEQYRQYTVRPEPEPAPAESDADSKSSGPTPSKSSGGAGGGGGSFSGGGMDNEIPDFDDLVDVPDESFLEDNDEGEGSDAGGEADVSDEPVEEATDISGVDDPQLALDTDSIKQALNETELTSGVIRVKTKNNELWVYYNDDTNLNDKMVDAIDTVQAEASNAEFNRLARSENAMVFQLSSNKGAVDEL